MRIAEKVNMPPSSGLMPQPCPATSPPQTKLTSRRSAGAVRQAAGHRLALHRGVRKVAEADAIKDVLPARQVFDQHLCGEVALGQRRDRRQRAGIPERLRRRHLDQHLRGTVGARPDHATVDGDVARLHAMGHSRPVGRAGKMRHCNRAKRAGTGREETAA
ncbi:hypothetical protein ACVWW2_000956 [Bradyrhizobium sp. LM4.3]